MISRKRFAAMPRLFTALEIPADVGQSLALLRGGLPGARWIDPENYHLTLRFIGDVDDVLAREVAYLLGGIRRPGFDVQLDGSIRSAATSRGRWWRPAQPVRPLIDLQAEHERLMQRVGLEPERKYKPHVTLARLRDASSRQVADYLSSAPAVPLDAVSGVALRAVLLARLGRRRSLCDRGGVSAGEPALRRA